MASKSRERDTSSRPLHGRSKTEIPIDCQSASNFSTPKDRREIAAGHLSSLQQLADSFDLVYGLARALGVFRA
jgi:hypothetical protein